MIDTSIQNKVEALDLTTVMRAVEKENPFTQEQLIRAEDLYRKFLMLCCAYPDFSIVPPRLVDAVWHEHIMDTRKYAQDCDSIFGYFMHHNPHIDMPEERYETTKELYKTEFSTDLMLHGVPHQALMQSALCGSG